MAVCGNVPGTMQLVAVLFNDVTNSRSLRWSERVARMGERRGVYRIWVRKPEGRRPLGRPRRIWEDNMDLREVRWGHGLD